MPLVSFYTAENIWNREAFWFFSGGIERNTWHEKKARSTTEKMYIYSIISWTWYFVNYSNLIFSTAKRRISIQWFIEDKLSKIIYTRSSYKDEIFYVEILSDEMRRSKRNDNMKLHGSRLPKNQSDLQNKKNTSIWFPWNQLATFYINMERLIEKAR